MFSRDSRYANAGSYTVTDRNGKKRVFTRFPVRSQPAVRGWHQRLESQRTDSVAAHYLGNATQFWRLCDASGVMAPDALEARERIAIPAEER